MATKAAAAAGADEEQAKQQEPMNAPAFFAALDTGSAQLAVVCFALFNFNMFLIHMEQLGGDLRFIYLPDAREAHPSRTLRVVRVIDVAVSFLFGMFLLVLGVGLCLNRLHSASAARRLRCGMLVVAAVYVVGGVTDLMQCHFQASGIGSHCNGHACFIVAGAFLVCVAVQMLHARSFWMFCLVTEAVYRVMWLRREGQRNSIGEWSLMVTGWIVVFVLYPLVLFFRGYMRNGNARADHDSRPAPGACDKPANHVLMAVLQHENCSCGGEEPCADAPPIDQVVRVKDESTVERVREDTALVNVSAPQVTRTASGALHQVFKIEPTSSTASSDDDYLRRPQGSLPELTEQVAKPCYSSSSSGSTPPPQPACFLIGQTASILKSPLYDDFIVNVLEMV